MKVCPVVTRGAGNHLEILVFQHPVAGTQLVKGTLEDGENPERGAIRELFEESGLRAVATRFLGAHPVGLDETLWSFWQCDVGEAPEQWAHQTLDDHGHVFEFRWHALGASVPADMPPDFRDALKFVGGALTGAD